MSSDEDHLVSVRRSPMERHFQSIIATLTAAGVIYVATQLTSLSTTVAVQSEQILSLRAQISTSLDNRYRSTDAVRDFQLRDERILRLEAALDRLEKTMDKFTKSGN